MPVKCLISSFEYKNYLRQLESLAWIKDTGTKILTAKKKKLSIKKRFWWLLIQYFYLFEYKLKLCSIQQQLKEDLGIVPRVC